MLSVVLCINLPNLGPKKKKKNRILALSNWLENDMWHKNLDESGFEPGTFC